MADEPIHMGSFLKDKPKNRLEHDIILLCKNHYKANAAGEDLQVRQIVMALVWLVMYHANKRVALIAATSDLFKKSRLSVAEATVKLLETAVSLDIYNSHESALLNRLIARCSYPFGGVELSLDSIYPLIDEISSEIRSAAVNDIRSGAVGADLHIGPEAVDPTFQLVLTLKLSNVDIPTLGTGDIYTLRKMLALSQSSVHGLYTDDGELTTTMAPVIDYIRDTPGEIQRKLYAAGAERRRSLGSQCDC